MRERMFNASSSTTEAQQQEHLCKTMSTMKESEAHLWQHLDLSMQTSETIESYDQRKFLDGCPASKSECIVLRCFCLSHSMPCNLAKACSKEFILLIILILSSSTLDLRISSFLHVTSSASSSSINTDSTRCEHAIMHTTINTQRLGTKLKINSTISNPR